MSTKKNEEKSQVSEINHETLDWLLKHDKDFLMSYYVLLQFYDSLSAQFTPKKWKDGRVLLTPKKQTYVKPTSIGNEGSGESSPSSSES